MNKVQVGATPSPNLKAIRSKIGSLQNATHKPGGGNVKIESKKIEVKAAPRIAARNDQYVPGGGDKKVSYCWTSIKESVSQLKPQWKLPESSVMSSGDKIDHKTAKITDSDLSNKLHPTMKLAIVSLSARVLHLCVVSKLGSLRCLLPRYVLK